MNIRRNSAACFFRLIKNRPLHGEVGGTLPLLRTQHKPGHAVPADGLYLATHDRHQAPHRGLLLAGEVFPYCATCKGRVRFKPLGDPSPIGAVSLLDHPCFRFRPRPATAESLFRAAFGRAMSAEEKQIISSPEHAAPLRPKAKGHGRGKS